MRLMEIVIGHHYIILYVRSILSGKVNVRIPASASILNSKDRSLQKVQRVSKQSGVKKGARATDFYGAAAARILNQNRKSQASSFRYILLFRQ